MVWLIGGDASGCADGLAGGMELVVELVVVLVVVLADAELLMRLSPTSTLPSQGRGVRTSCAIDSSLACVSCVLGAALEAVCRAWGSDRGSFWPQVPCYVHALELKPQYVRALSNLGISYGNMRTYEAAAQCYLKALPHHSLPRAQLE